ncbi:magnesium transporter CorA family protein [Novosphingobium sp. Gsoil 351]|uniref:magnesium transporter CorA family protein n=1 Tax=Novosphingobium sp. Gsoil 351 TaxID=2675225 RepID=UPI0012B4D2DD|nr:CorA family divalent cation transporter [Novosphingobium sp. Gsoil 351]QGN55771.1 hypothetical protein GKE62_15660 [Novosphingobium sp. Gsoil 351]
MSSAAFFYDAEGSDRPIQIDEALHLDQVRQHQLVWFDLDTADGDVVARVYDELAVPTGATQAQHTRAGRGVAVYESLINFRLVRACVGDDPINFIVGEHWLITVSTGGVSYFEEFRERDRGESLLGGLSPLALAGSLMDWHLEEFHQEVEAIQQRLDELDSEILHQRTRKSPLVDLTRLRRRTARLRARLDWHRPLVHGMLRPDFYPAANEDQRDFFHTLEAHFNRAQEALDRARELVVGSFELYATRTAQNTNDLVRALTIVTVAIGLSAAVAGVFGMNFDIPFFHTGAVGFVIVTTAMILTALALFWFARVRDWL